MKKIRLPLGRASYTIVIGSRVLSAAGARIKALGAGTDAIIITNSRIARLYAAALKSSLARQNISSRIILVPDTERAKSIDMARRILERIAARDTLRKTFIIALGGGVVGDLAGFVASLYKRGIPFVQIPTTLLAQVDSAIGGKTAVDLPIAKNLAGTFYQPRIVLSDVDVLASLPRRQIANGLAEIIKYGVIKEAALFAYLERNFPGILGRDRRMLAHIIDRSSRIKAAVVAKDEYDVKGVRAILNFGHTIGHAIETASGYSGRYTHGEAIALGMIVASDIALALGIMALSDRNRIEALIRNCGLPTLMRGVQLSDIKKAFLHDKKFTNRKNRFVLPTKIGSVRIVEGIPEKIIIDALKARRAP
jgi:3-dehydroquinate synthase